MVSIIPSFVACYFLFIGIFILKQNKNNRLAKILFFICLTTFAWQFTWSILFQSSEFGNGLILAKVGWVFILFLPTALYHFLTVLSQKEDEMRKVFYSYCFSLVLLVFLLFSNFLISGLYSYHWGYYPKGGILHPLHVIQTSVVVLRGLYITYQKQKTATFKIKSQLRYCIIGLLIYLFAAIDYLCNYGIEFYPPGIIFITFGLTIISYTIIKHKLLDVTSAISVVVSRIIIYSIFISIFIICYFFITGSLLPDNQVVVAIGLVIFIFVCEGYGYVKEKIQNLLEIFLVKDEKKYQNAINLLNKNLETCVSLEDLHGFIKYFSSVILDAKLLSFYVRDDILVISDSKDLPKNHYVSFVSQEKKLASINISDDFAKKVIESRSFVDDSRLDQEGLEIDKSNKIFIPFIASENMFGFMMISPNAQSLSNKSYEIFDLLTSQIGIALDRIKAYRKIHLQQEQFLKEKIEITKSLAGSIAHEMRNPLNAINLSLNNILELLPKKADIEKKLYLSDDQLQKINEYGLIIVSSIRRTNQVIDATLNDLKGKKINVKDLKSFYALKLVQKVVVEYGYKSNEEKGKVKLNMVDDFIFKVDEDLFFYVIFNLIKNALYYLSEYPDSTITITSKSDEDFNYISVRDTGPGVPAEKIGELFGDFVTSGKKGGTGLGLAFCKRTMKSFNGDIWCESEFGKYTDFIMKFPKVAPSEKISKTEEITIDDAFKTHILLVDDQKVNLMVNKKLLEERLKNVVCDLAYDGKEAVELAQEKKYALILMDLQMKIMDGYSAAKIIKTFNDKIPIITYSSLNQLHQENQDMQNVFNDNLSKPISNDLLLRTVVKWGLVEYGEVINLEKTHLENRKILLVDDQDINRMLTAKFLKEKKIIIDEAKNGKEALEKIQNNKYDLVLMDIQMPIMNGIEAIIAMREYQSEKNINKIPAIALSGDGSKEDIHKFLNAGFNDYFVKGGDYNQLLNLIELWIAEDCRDIITGDCMTKQAEPRKTISSKLSDEMLIEFAPIFLNEANDLLQKIKQDFAKTDLDQFLFDSHAFKGICGNIGAEKIFEYCVIINDVAKAGKWPEDKDFIIKLDEMIKEFENEILRLKNSTKT